MSTRAAIEAAWRVARAQSELRGALVLNPAAAAGWLLERSDGDAHAALQAATYEETHHAWWRHARDHLALLVSEDCAGAYAEGAE